MGSAREWMPRMHEAGVVAARGFPEWQTLEPRKGEWHWEKADAFVQAAGENHLEITALLMGTVPGSSEKPHTFPMSDLEAWSGFVGQSVARYKDRIHRWEIWNEGNGGFNGGHHTSADYGRLAAAAYSAAKQADPAAQVGLTTASFDPAYLHEAILVQKAAGTPGQFDYLCIHPYELADGIGRPNGEVPFLWMTHLCCETCCNKVRRINRTPTFGSPKSGGMSRIARTNPWRNAKPGHLGEAVCHGVGARHSTRPVVRGAGPAGRGAGFRIAQARRRAARVL